MAIWIVIWVVLGMVNYGSTIPLPASKAYSAGQALGTGFIEGYNTLNALASMALSVVPVNTLKQFGFSSKREYVSTIGSVGLVVPLASSALYVGWAF
ncbi:Branched-chain amino acid permease [Streptococcus suis 98HAH33]|nr:Branched-chain amino acid permease [Streptococcus suis 98HAH33]